MFFEKVLQISVEETFHRFQNCFVGRGYPLSGGLLHSYMPIVHESPAGALA
jgi:hypothetical protein